jgi:hypothetical protein
MDRFASLAPDPEQQASNSEIRRLLEKAVEKLPDAYRTIFMLREVEDMSTTDAADVLEITEENAKVRLHRARALLRKSLYARAGMERREAFNFHAVRCDRVVKNVLKEFRSKSRKLAPPRRPLGDSLLSIDLGRDCAMLTSFATTNRPSSSSRASRGLRDGLRLLSLRISSRQTITTKMRRHTRGGYLLWQRISAFAIPARALRR